MKGLGAERSNFRDLMGAGAVDFYLAAWLSFIIATATIAVDFKKYERMQFG